DGLASWNAPGARLRTGRGRAWWSAVRNWPPDDATTGPLIELGRGLHDWQATHTNAAISDHDQGSLVEILGNCVEVSEQHRRLSLRPARHVAPEEHDARCDRLRVGHEGAEVSIER